MLIFSQQKASLDLLTFKIELKIRRLWLDNFSRNSILGATRTQNVIALSNHVLMSRKIFRSKEYIRLEWFVSHSLPQNRFSFEASKLEKLLNKKSDSEVSIEDIMITSFIWIHQMSALHTSTQKPHDFQLSSRRKKASRSRTSSVCAVIILSFDFSRC